MKVFAPAKINLSLEILGRRSDGFHEIDTWMVPIALADQLTLEPREEGGIRLACNDPALAGPDNLALRAAQLFAAQTGRTLHLEIGLEKKIPHGAGLGGGSSDAAAVLLALDEIHGTQLGQARLIELAAELGSDIPFFILRGAARCRGRGEKVEPADGPGGLPLLLLKPDFGVPTPSAYRRWQDSREIPGIPYAPQIFPWGRVVNDLERPVFEKYLVLAELKRWLLDQPETAGALLSGSGSTTLAFLHEAGTGAALAERAEAAFGTLWTCVTTIRV